MTGVDRLAVGLWQSGRYEGLPCPRRFSSLRRGIRQADHLSFRARRGEVVVWYGRTEGLLCHPENRPAVNTLSVPQKQN
jgi:hypothetical protein